MTITVLGLGPGNPAQLTREAWSLLSKAKEVYLRTKHHPTVDFLPKHLILHSFDDLYETLDDFAAVYETIAERVIDLGQRPQGVIYAVPGHPLVGESSVQHILSRARKTGMPVRLIAGLSFIEPVLTALGLDGLDNLQLADATDLAAALHPLLDPDRPALVGQLYNRRLASEVKLTLMNAYPDDHPLTLIQGAGTEEERIIQIPLYELDREPHPNHLTTLYVPPLTHAASLSALQDTIARLRAPDGCPWDREQTHQTLRPHLLEETYEVLAAIDADEPTALCEELGDLLMQIAMHVQIAIEEGDFFFADVIGQIDAKLKRRHPHVFGDLEVHGTEEVLRNWEAIKARERATKGQAHRSRPDGVPIALPALARAQALADRADRTAEKHPNLTDLLARVGAAAADVHHAETLQQREEQFGDLLFALADAARLLGVNAEDALRQACNRFVADLSKGGDEDHA